MTATTSVTATPAAEETAIPYLILLSAFCLLALLATCALMG